MSLFSFSEKWQEYSFLHQWSVSVTYLQKQRYRSKEAGRWSELMTEQKRWVVSWLDQQDGMTLQMWFSSGMGNRWSYKAALIKMILRSPVLLETGHNWKEGKPNHVLLRHRIHNIQTSLSETFQKDIVESFRRHMWQWNTVTHQWVKPLHKASAGIKLILPLWHRES